ncbi:MAG: type III secretion system export apparatus subunit SctS [bacterium]
MDQSVIVELSSKAMSMVLLLSLPSILLATFVGLGVSLLQALTQIQEQTLSFAVRLICITLCIMMTAHWMGTELVRYTDSIFTLIKQWAGR